MKQYLVERPNGNVIVTILSNKSDHTYLSYDEKLKSFYEKIGFSELCSDREIMVLTAD